MLRTLFTLSLLGLLAASSGCAMCSSCDDESYSAYGGRWQRQDMTQGRVGSAFAPAGAKVTTAMESTATEGLVEMVESDVTVVSGN